MKLDDFMVITSINRLYVYQTQKEALIACGGFGVYQVRSYAHWVDGMRITPLVHTTSIAGILF